MISASSLSSGSVILKYLNSRSISSSQSSHALTVAIGSSSGENGWDFRFLVAVITCTGPAGSGAFSVSRVVVFCLLASLSGLQTFLARFFLLSSVLLLLNRACFPRRQCNNRESFST